jgi:spore coat protein U-like protein
MKRRLLLVLMLLASAGPKLLASCGAPAATALNFGNYTGVVSTSGGSTITLTCTSGTSYTIGLSAGQTSGATVTTRQMTSSAGGTLHYALYRDAARSANWGTTIGTDTDGATGTGSAQQFNVYPRAIGGQYVTPGTYTDSILVEIIDSAFNLTYTTFNVTATVVPSCTVSASALSFGNYINLLKNATSIVAVTCTNTTTYNIGLNAGTGSGATVSNRLMTRSSITLPYRICQDAAFTLNWGNTVGTDTESGTGNGTPQNLSAYGQVPAGHLIAPGIYSDTITASVTY